MQSTVLYETLVISYSLLIQILQGIHYNNREEFSFRIVVALPRLSRIGVAHLRIISSRLIPVDFVVADCEFLCTLQFSTFDYW